MSKVFDLFIIGGGINGAGIARDAAGRGLSVCLADKGEIGGATSSWSTKLLDIFQNLFHLLFLILIKLDQPG